MTVRYENDYVCNREERNEAMLLSLSLKIITENVYVLIYHYHTNISLSLNE